VRWNGGLGGFATCGDRIALITRFALIGATPLRVYEHAKGSARVGRNACGSALCNRRSHFNDADSTPRIRRNRKRSTLRDSQFFSEFCARINMRVIAERCD